MMVNTIFAACDRRWIVLSVLFSGCLSLLVFGPIALTLNSLWSYSTSAPQIAKALDATVFFDTTNALDGASASVGMAAIFALLMVFLLSPILQGALLASFQSRPNRLSYSELVAAGMRDYGRMLRMQLLCLLLLGIAGVAAGTINSIMVGDASDYISQTTYRAQSRLALGANITMLAAVYFLCELARARLASEPALRSVFRALLQAIRTITLGQIVRVVLVSVFFAVLIFALMLLRVRLSASGAVALCAGFAVTQVIAAALAWWRAARLAVLLHGGGTDPG
jgi:hypothetical protein